MECLSDCPEPHHGDKECDPRHCEMSEIKHALSIPVAASGRNENEAPLRFTSRGVLFVAGF